MFLLVKNPINHHSIKHNAINPPLKATCLSWDHHPIFQRWLVTITPELYIEHIPSHPLETTPCQQRLTPPDPPAFDHDTRDATHCPVPRQRWGARSRSQDLHSWRPGHRWSAAWTVRDLSSDPFKKKKEVRKKESPPSLEKYDKSKKKSTGL